MTPLTQQLEDKKKGCIKLIETFNTPDGDLGERYCGDVFLGEVRYCRECQEIIAILEQAIAEKNEFIKDEIKFLEYIERQLISAGEKVYTSWIKQEVANRKSQLNQPKEEQ